MHTILLKECKPNGRFWPSRIGLLAGSIGGQPTYFLPVPPPFPPDFLGHSVELSGAGLRGNIEQRARTVSDVWTL